MYFGCHVLGKYFITELLKYYGVVKMNMVTLARKVISIGLSALLFNTNIILSEALAILLVVSGILVEFGAKGNEEKKIEDENVIEFVEKKRK